MCGEEDWWPAALSRVVESFWAFFSTQNADIGIFCPRDNQMKYNGAGSSAPGLR